MQSIQTVSENTIYVGASDRRLAKFENLFPIPRGVSYNAYVILDEKTALLDTADASVGAQFLENVAAALDGRKLDYLIVDHMEPDHAAMIEAVLVRWPDLRLVVNAKTLPMLKMYFPTDSAAFDDALVVKEGDTLDLGKHKLTFVMAPMVHWPEVMMTFDTTTGTLFSADAFGTFGALEGALFADEVDFAGKWLDDARRYYTNIVGKYGVQVQAVLKKAAPCPSRPLPRCTVPCGARTWAGSLASMTCGAAANPKKRRLLCCTAACTATPQAPPTPWPPKLPPRA